MDFWFRCGDYDVTVDTLYVRPLLGGVMQIGLEFARAHLDEEARGARRRFLEDLDGVWGPGRRVVLLNELPTFGPHDPVEQIRRILGLRIGAVWLESTSGIEGGAQDGSRAFLVWTQDPGEELFPPRIRDLIDWRSMAVD